MMTNEHDRYTAKMTGHQIGCDCTDCALVHTESRRAELATKNCFLVRSKINPKLLLTVSGEFMPESLCGPGMYCAKIYKTRRGAENVGTNDSRTVHACTAQGIE